MAHAPNNGLRACLWSQHIKKYSQPHIQTSIEPRKSHVSTSVLTFFCWGLALGLKLLPKTRRALMKYQHTSKRTHTHGPTV